MTDREWEIAALFLAIGASFKPTAEILFDLNRERQNRKKREMVRAEEERAQAREKEARWRFGYAPSAVSEKR